MEQNQSQLIRTARMAGLWYLLMAITGILGFVVLHPQVFDSNPEQTLKNITSGVLNARLRLLLEFGIILAQALTAIWFYRLFKQINNWAALATGIWGMVNAILIMLSAVAMASTIEIALSSTAADIQIHQINLLTTVMTHAWGIGGLFFGLWLMPLGYIVTSTKRMPVWLGRTLIIGGIGYLISTFLTYSGYSGIWRELLTVPATIAEFWMIGYLFAYGIRPVQD